MTHLSAAWLALCMALGVAGQSPARLARTFNVPPDRPIVVEATVADVSIAAWTRPDVEVQIDRRADGGADLARIEPRLEDREDSLVVSTRQTEGPPDRALRAAITIRAPAAAIFRSIDVLDGRLVLEGLRGSVSASLRQGSIDGFRLAGTIRLETGFGNVDLRQTELTPGGLLHLRAFNGNVMLRLARVPVDARILALSFNGKVTSDIPLTMKEKFGPKFGEAMLGKGEPVISLDAVYGDVSIRVER
jgi:hypothetical protein